MTRMFAAICAVLWLLAGGPASALPKERLLGQWSGNGHLVHPDTGHQLRLMCRLRGEDAGAEGLTLTLRCATLQEAQTVPLLIAYDPSGAVGAVTVTRADGTAVPLAFVADAARLTLTDPVAGVLDLTQSDTGLILSLDSPNLGAGVLDLSPD
ncbi:hypothetical protein FHS89_000263 [Rubricella aquisinus]|uniref:Uncharacterized protein n=1 Tax=Rubricella aquisinus TaxID=2028108 RepID=A0A840WX52_9RHOB|nr:hypothetical protein [Rubricella aquisinus]MBB5514265.1 hypothetical protein [Rubricella aquisinus]